MINIALVVTGYVLIVFVVSADILMQIIAATIIIGTCIAMSWRSGSQASIVADPNVAMRPIIIDIISSWIILSITMIWSLIPNFSGAYVAKNSYYVVLVFFVAAFLIAASLAIFRISLTMQQMYRKNVYSQDIR